MRETGNIVGKSKSNWERKWRESEWLKENIMKSEWKKKRSIMKTEWKIKGIYNEDWVKEEAKYNEERVKD
jgi:hypothetical protein